MISDTVQSFDVPATAETEKGNQKGKYPSQQRKSRRRSWLVGDRESIYLLAIFKRNDGYRSGGYGIIANHENRLLANRASAAAAVER